MKYFFIEELLVLDEDPSCMSPSELSPKCHPFRYIKVTINDWDEWKHLLETTNINVQDSYLCDQPDFKKFLNKKLISIDISSLESSIDEFRNSLVIENRHTRKLSRRKMRKMIKEECVGDILTHIYYCMIRHDLGIYPRNTGLSAILQIYHPIKNEYIVTKMYDGDSHEKAELLAEADV